MSDCNFGLTKKRKCICFVPDTVTVPASHGCYVIALQIVMNSPFVLKVFEGRVITEEGGIIHLTL
jgi:hypothetical protein